MYRGANVDASLSCVDDGVRLRSNFGFKSRSPWMQLPGSYVLVRPISTVSLLCEIEQSDDLVHRLPQV